MNNDIQFNSMEWYKISPLLFPVSRPVEATASLAVEYDATEFWQKDYLIR